MMFLGLFTSAIQALTSGCPWPKATVKSPVDACNLRPLFFIFYSLFFTALDTLPCPAPTLPLPCFEFSFCCQGQEESGPGFQDLDIRLSGPGFQAPKARFQDLDLRTWVSGPQREVSRPGSQDLGFRPSMRGFKTWISGPGFQALNARFQDLDLRTWVSGPQREVSRSGSQDLGFRPSVFGSQDLGFKTSKVLHPTVVLFFSRHFSLRPPSLFFFLSLFSASTVASTVTVLYVQWSLK
jgi:hypothetical protein